MSRFLIDENINQRAVRTVPVEDKNFDIVYPEGGGFKGATDAAILKKASSEGRVLVSQEKDFGQFHLRPEDLPDGAIWLRPIRTGYQAIVDLFSLLCTILLREFPRNPYDFGEKIIEVFPDRVVIYSRDGESQSFTVV